MVIALAVVGEEQVTERLTEGPQKLEVRLVQWGRQPVAQAPSSGTFERVELIGSSRQLLGVLEAPDQLEFAWRLVGSRTHRAHRRDLFTGKTR